MENRLRHIRKLKKLTLEEVARKTGYSFAKVQRDELGKTQLTPRKIHMYSKAYGCSENDILGLGRENNPAIESSPHHEKDTPSATQHAPVVSFGPDTVPILGRANCAGSGALVINFDEHLGELPRHPNQVGLKLAFVVYPNDESMHPMFKHGKPVYIGGHMTPTKDEGCLIQMQDGISYLKEFIRQTTTEVVCRQYNPPKEVRYKLKDIEALHAVVGTGRA